MLLTYLTDSDLLYCIDFIITLLTSFVVSARVRVLISMSVYCIV